MKHLGTKKLDTERLILRRFTMEDAKAMYDNWASDPMVTKYLTWQPYESVETGRAVLSDWISKYDDPEFYQWAIVPRVLGEPIGSISVVSHNHAVESVHIGYCIGRHWWHRGIMTEALNAVIAFFFEEVGVNKVESRHDPYNPNSGAVMRKCGMTYEGTIRQSDRNNQGICDADWYGILVSEWKK